jgi:hypothetical protein
MINQIITQLKSRFQDSDEEELLRLGFNPNLDDHRLFALLKKGWWHSFFFGDDDYYFWGLRILPQNSYPSWPVIKETAGENAWTFAPRLDAFPAMVRWEDFKRPRLFQGFREIWESVTPIMQEFYNIAGGSQYHDFLTEFVMNDDNIPQNDEQILSNYLRFWNTVDPSIGHKELRNLITTANANPDWVPPLFGDVDLGHWETRVLNGAATLSGFRREKVERSQVVQACWQSFCQPHGYEPEELCPKHYPNFSNNPATCLETTVGRLQIPSNFTGLPQEIQSSPLFAALVSLAGRKNQYQGIQHAEAAILFDKEHNDPLMAWNCLVSAAYWSGRNSPETLIPVWKAAIELCEANNWKDAHEALVHQWDFYHDFKKRNNLA